MRLLLSWFALLGMVLLGGCAHQPDISYFTLDEADQFIVSTVGTTAPAVTLGDYYEQDYLYGRMHGYFSCNSLPDRKGFMTMKVTRGQGNYVELAVTQTEECESDAQWRAVGRYNDQWLLVRILDSGARTTSVVVYKLEQKGALYGDVADKFGTVIYWGKYMFADGVRTFYESAREDEEVSDDVFFRGHGFRLTSEKFNSVNETQQMMANRSKWAEDTREEKPSTAAQIAQFGQVLAGTMQEQAAIRQREAEAGRQMQEKMDRIAREGAESAARQQAEAAERRDRAQAAATATQQAAAAQAQADARRAEEAKRAAEARRADEEARRAAEQQALEKKRQEEQRAAQAKRGEAERQAAAAQAEQVYLRTMAAGIRLTATKCPDGEGHYYVTGTRPKVTPEVVGCIDVAYEASCPQGPASRGVAENFLGMNGCFGDTYQIEPKPACDIGAVQVRVTDVSPGCSLKSSRR